MKYHTIYADPPWPFNDKLDPTRHKPYSTMTVEEIKKLDINNLADDEAHLYLWVPNSFLKGGLEVIESWGFAYKLPIVWVKVTSSGKIWFGMGRYFRNSTELLLFGVKGNLKIQTKNTRNIFFSERPNLHSAKPAEAYEIIERNSLAPRLELFARSRREGWETWGNEVISTVEVNRKI